jgi:choline transport protein
MYIGLDAAMHMAEECTDPEKTVPRTMLAAIGIGFVTGFAYAVAVLYGITDIEEIMTTTG